MAFDQTLDFLLSNFSSHDFVWTVGIFTLDAKLFGLENVTRACPIIIYETEDTSSLEAGYFVRACGEVSQLDLVAEAPQLLNVSETNALF